ncbi:MAG: translocation/assembly module TamB domain-containing protein [Anaeromyxobacteraceae bacterium]
MAVLSLAALAVVLVLGALTLVATPAGGERLRAFVVEKANATIEGKLAARRLSLRGGHLLLEGVELRDPEGERVASASALEVRLRLVPLARKRIELALVRLDRPELRVRQDGSGASNLQRALAPRNPSPEEKEEGGGSGLAFVLDALQIDRGVVDLVQRSAGVSRHVHVDDLGARGSARAVGGALAARLTVQGAFAAPFDGPLRVDLDVAGAGARKDARLEVTVGTAKLAGAAHLDDAAHAAVRIDSLVLPPAIARAFAPTYPLRAAASLSGDVRRDGDALSFALDAGAGSARARVEGDYGLASKRTRRTTVTVRHVDLAELAGGPPSDVALSLVAQGGGTSLDDLDGRVELRVPRSRMGREVMGPVHVLASAAGGELRLADAQVRVPGVRVAAKGRASRARLDVRGDVVASDLAALGRTLGGLAGSSVASLSGSGRLAFALAGTAEHPSLSLRGGFPVLAYGDARVDGLTAEVEAPDLKVPTGATAHLAAAKVALAPGKVFRGVRADLDGRGGELALDAEVHGYAELALAARAKLARGGRAGTLTALSLRYPEARWGLESPVRFESREGALKVSPLTLRAGSQTISARVQRRGTRLDAAVALRAVDLARLPRAFVDPALGLGGLLDVDARAQGAAAKPDVVAKVALRDGRFRKYRRLQLSVDASYARDQAKGTVAADGEGVKLSGVFDVPVKALRDGRSRLPVKVELTVPELRIDDALRELGATTPLSGLVSAQVSLRGTAGDPRLAVAVRGRQIRMRDVPPSDLALALDSADDGRLRARLDLALEGKESFAEVRTPFTLGELLRSPPDREALLARSVALEADLRELPLRLLAQAGIASRPVDGTVSAKAHLAGPPRALRGRLAVEANGLTTRRLEPVAARLLLDVGDELRAELHADQQGRSLVAAKVRVGASAASLQDAAALAEAPLSVDANVGPLSLREWQDALQPDDIDPAHVPPQVRGTLAGRLTASGTLRDPRAALRATVDGLGADRSPDGAVELAFDYRGAREKLDLVLRSPGKGELRASAASRLDLSYPAVKAAKRLGDLPVEATLRASDFDPGFLANLTGAFEKLGGLVYADARVGGTVDAPSVNGTLEWRDGLVFTHGNGDFTNIHLRARGDNDRLEVEELSAKSGSGTAKLAALATRAGGGRFKLHATADLDKLPVMSEGQVTATVSIRGTADGDASASRLLIRELLIPEAHVQLPDVHRKDVQKLKDPPDVVLTLRGKPVRGAKKKAPEPTPETLAVAGGRGSGAAGAADEAGGPMRVVVRVNAPRNLWIQGNDVNTEIGLSEGFRVEYAGAPRVSGDVNVIRGRLDVFGRRFDLQRDSKVSFAGPPLLPDLDVTAKYKNEVEQVTVTLKVQGQAEKLALQPTSDPPLSETDIYTLLATGHTSLRHGSGASSPSGQAASLVGSLAASQLKGALASKLPLDVISIEAGDNGLEGSKLEAGTYVSDRFYVGFTGRIGADPMRGENSNEVDLEYQLSKHWSLNGSYGDARAGGAGVLWRKDY